MLKLGICRDCIKVAENRNETCKKVQVIAGRCGFHYKVHRAKECLARNGTRMLQKPAIKRKNTYRNIVKQQEPEISCNNTQNTAIITQSKSQTLVSWYEDRLNEFKGVCAECGERIDQRYCYASVAHVLPKKKGFGGFPSVAKHPENAIELGAGCGCHRKYDKSWLSASKMKVFELAKTKFKIMEPFIADEEKSRIPEVFL